MTGTDDALTFADDEVPAIDWDRRLGWRGLLDSLGKCQRLVVADQDRIGRDARRLVELQQIEEAVSRCGPRLARASPSSRSPAR